MPKARCADSERRYQNLMNALGSGRAESVRQSGDQAMTIHASTARQWTNFSQSKHSDYFNRKTLFSATVSRTIMILAVGVALTACSSARSQRESVQQVAPEVAQLNEPPIAASSPAQEDEEKQEEESAELDSENEDNEEKTESAEIDEDVEADDEEEILFAEPFINFNFSRMFFEDALQFDGGDSADNIKNENMNSSRSEIDNFHQSEREAFANTPPEGENLQDPEMANLQPRSEAGNQADTQPASGASENTDDRAPLARISFAGSWSATKPDGSSCRITLSMAGSGNTLNASTSGCTHPELENVSGWELRGDTVLLYRAGQSVAARLLAVPGSMSGLIAGSGQPVTLSR